MTVNPHEDYTLPAHLRADPDPLLDAPVSGTLDEWEQDDSAEPPVTPQDVTGEPAVPPLWRSRLFFTSLVLSALVALSTGLSAVWLPAYAEQVAATGAAFLSALGIITGGLGITYRQSAGVLR